MWQLDHHLTYPNVVLQIFYDSAFIILLQVQTKGNQAIMKMKRIEKSGL